jgi:hypothetical protein
MPDRKRQIGLFAGMLIAALFSLAFSSRASAEDRPFHFALVGDTGYTAAGVAGFQHLLPAINRADLAFVVHIGDFENDGSRYDPTIGAMPCTDENYRLVYDSFQSVRHPFILTPGDNDWTDCHFLKSPAFDPLDRLAKVRKMFFPEGKSLGQRTIEVESQSKNDPEHTKFVENLRWSYGGVTFVTLHIVGSNDNFGRTPEMDDEYRERKAANLAWIRSGFATAKTKGSRGIVLLAQADPRFENYWPPAAKTRYLGSIPGAKLPDQPVQTAFEDYVKTLADELESYDKPVAFLHGDTHWFRIDQPLFSEKVHRRFENFTRVETFGDPDTHWVRVTVDPADPQLFQFNPEIVPENMAVRKK